MDNIQPVQRLRLPYIPKTQQFVVIVVRERTAGQVWGVLFNPLHSAFDIRSIEHTKLWLERQVTEPMFAVEIEIVHMCEKRIDARLMADKLRMELRPVTNGARRYGKRVKRMDTGQIWNSARQAAEAHHISTGAMSSHLNRKKNYATIHGLVFEFVAEGLPAYESVVPQPPPMQNAKTGERPPLPWFNPDED